MQTNCFLFDVRQLNRKDAFEKAYDALFYEYRKEKIGALTCVEDKKRSLGVGLLIEYAFRENGIEYPTISLSKKGKPTIEEGYFNAAHSGDLAVLAVSSFPVGVDVERIRPVSPLVQEKFFTDRERAQVQTEQDFFRLWTKKESYVKYLGEGIGALRSFEISPSSPIYQEVDFYEKAWQGHQISVCVQKGEPLTFTQVSLDDLLKK